MNYGEFERKDLEKLASEMGEHWDTVQIFVTRCESGELGGTRHVAVGVGNIFARHGHVRQWLVRSNEEDREETRIDMHRDESE